MESRVEPKTKTITVRVTPEEYKRVLLLKLESNRKIREIVMDAVNREWAKIQPDDDTLTPDEERRMAAALAEYRAGQGESLEDVRRQLLEGRDD